MNAETAAELAPHLDRIALCIHGPTSRRPELMAVLGPLELPPQSLVVVAARFLAARRMSVADVQSVSRYVPATGIEALVEAHARRGLISSTDSGDGVFTPSAGLQSGAKTVLDLQAEEADRLWGGSGDLSRAHELASLHVAAALESRQPLEAFRGQVRVHHVLPASHAGQVLGYVTELRYLRSDVHAACLADVGLAGPPARVLHRLWRGVEPREPIDKSLLGQRLVELHDDRPVVTDAGAATCERVESATNRVFADLFDAVDDDESSALLACLGALAGEDPRPIEDR